jgi:hypothetical protein
VIAIAAVIPMQRNSSVAKRPAALRFAVRHDVIRLNDDMSDLLAVIVTTFLRRPMIRLAG